MAIDFDSGTASEAGVLYSGDKEEGVEVVVNLCREDEEEFSITFCDGKDRRCLRLPIDRLRRLCR